jgi:hypothetical protein
VFRVLVEIGIVQQQRSLRRVPDPDMRAVSRVLRELTVPTEREMWKNVVHATARSSIGCRVAYTVLSLTAPTQCSTLSKAMLCRCNLEVRISFPSSRPGAEQPAAKAVPHQRQAFAKTGCQLLGPLAGASRDPG